MRSDCNRPNDALNSTSCKILLFFFCQQRRNSSVKTENCSYRFYLRCQPVKCFQSDAVARRYASAAYRKVLLNSAGHRHLTGISTSGFREFFKPQFQWRSSDFNELWISSGNWLHIYLLFKMQIFWEECRIFCETATHSKLKVMFFSREYHLL